MVHPTKKLTQFFKFRLQCILKEDDGAVTADMVMLMAGVVAMGMTVYTVFDPNNMNSPLGWWLFVLRELLRWTII